MILSHKENWDLGAREEKSLCGPTYHWGGLLTYREERYEAETLRHHQAALLYNVLEPDWLQNSGETSNDENLNPNMNRSVDISLKDDMTVRDGPYGDNEVYPYFDIVRALCNNKYYRSDGKLARFMLWVGELDE